MLPAHATALAMALTAQLQGGQRCQGAEGGGWNLQFYQVTPLGLRQLQASQSCSIT